MADMYQVQLKIGSTTKLEHLEFKSLADCQSFFTALCVAKVTRILGNNANFFTPSAIVPIDDFNYRPCVRGVYYNKTSRMSRAFMLHFVKLTVNEKQLLSLFQQFVKIDSLSVDGIYLNSFGLKATP
jgi:hypothetical protein